MYQALSSNRHTLHIKHYTVATLFCGTGKLNSGFHMRDKYSITEDMSSPKNIKLCVDLIEDKLLFKYPICGTSASSPDFKECPP